MYKIYNVNSGETINDIASKLLSTPDDIRKINGFDLNYEVNYGEQLVVPVFRQQLFDVYTVKRGDTLAEIAKMYNISSENLALLNGLDLNEYIYPKQEILVPKSGVQFYVSKSGDTVASMADYFKVTPQQLMEQNPVIYLLPEQLLVYKKEK